MEKNLYFITIGSNGAIWLASLPLLIRAQRTLLTSMCHAMPLSALKDGWLRHFDNDILVKNKSTVASVVCALKDNNVHHHNSQNIMVSQGTAKLVCNILTTAITNIMVSKSADHTMPLLICFLSLTISTSKFANARTD